MPNETSNIGEFKKFCEEFDIRFVNTDDRQTRNMKVQYKVDCQIIINESISVHFIHSVNYCKIDIGNYEHLGIHCEASTQWQDFQYNKTLGKLVVTGTSSQYGHRYEIAILCS